MSISAAAALSAHVEIDTSARRHGVEDDDMLTPSGIDGRASCQTLGSAGGGDPVELNGWQLDFIARHPLAHVGGEAQGV